MPATAQKIENESDEITALCEALTEMGASELQIRIAKRICDTSGIRRAIKVAESWAGVSPHLTMRAIRINVVEEAKPAQPELPWWVE